MLAIKLFLFLALSIGRFEGKVVGVMDGDTIEVLKDGKAVRVRLNGIDCPEKNQPYGSKAKSYVSTLVFNKQVKVIVTDIDRYGRSVADVYLSDGTWLNKKLVEDGYAWHYKYYSTDKHLSASEATARKNKRGLWADNQPVPPWQYRKLSHAN